MWWWNFESSSCVAMFLKLVDTIDWVVQSIIIPNCAVWMSRTLEAYCGGKIGFKQENNNQHKKNDRKFILPRHQTPAVFCVPFCWESFEGKLRNVCIWDTSKVPLLFLTALCVLVWQEGSSSTRRKKQASWPFRCRRRRRLEEDLLRRGGGGVPRHTPRIHHHKL